MESILVCMPLSYNRDMQEDKRPLLGAADALALTADAVAGAIATATFHADVMEAALGSGEALATDAAEYLVDRGVPFREAHEAVGKAAQARDLPPRAAHVALRGRLEGDPPRPSRRTC